LTAEGATAAEAIDRLAEQIQTRLLAGAKLTELNVAAGAAPWKEDAGYLRNDPLYPVVSLRFDTLAPASRRISVPQAPSSGS
jgi:hypothetical protein